MAAPTFGVAGTYLESPATGTTAAFPAPAGVVANSLVVIVSFVDGGSTGITLPGGFTHAEGSPVTEPQPGGNAYKTVVAWHRASGSESGPYTMTIDNAAMYMSGQATRYDGVVTSGNPFDSPTNVAGTISNVSASPSVAITTAGADRLVLHVASNWDAGIWTPNTGYTKRQQGGAGAETLSDLTLAVAGSTGSVVATCGGASNKSQAWLGALIPDSGGGGSAPTISTASEVDFVAVSTPTPVGTTTSASTVSITPTLPTGSASGDRVFVVQAANNTSGTSPASWTAAGKDVQVGPTGTAPGAGTGRRYLSVSYRDYDGAWTMPAFTLTSATQNTHAISVITLRKVSGATWDTPTVSTAGNTGAAGTAYSVTTGSVAAPSGMVIVGTATNDNVTASAESLTSSAMTFANLAERSDTGSATGNDVSIKSYTADVYSGGTGTITHAATLSGASEGGTIVVAQTSTASGPAFPPRRRSPNYRR